LYVIWYIASLTSYWKSTPPYCMSYDILLVLLHTVYSILYEIRLAIYHMINNMAVYSILCEVRLKKYSKEYPIILYVIWYIVSLTSYRPEYPPYCMSYDILSVLLHTGQSTHHIVYHMIHYQSWWCTLSCMK
jgi:hypothetical protein